MARHFLLTLIYTLIFSVFAGAEGLYKSHSVLSSGTWIKVAVQHTGIHKVTYNDFVVAGMDPAGMDPADIRVYGNGEGMLAESNSINRIDDLLENSIVVVDGGDGQFDPGDYILFYGQSPHAWKLDPDSKLFLHEKNLFTDHNYYFITADLGPGKRVMPVASLDTVNANSYSRRFSDYAFYETETRNLIRSGKMWVGEEFNDTVQAHDFFFYFPNVDTSSAMRFNTYVVARSAFVSSFYLYVDDILVDEIPVDYTDFQNSNVFARSKLKGSLHFKPHDSTRVRLEYELPVSNSLGWLNYLEINLQRRLIWAGPQMPFRDVNSMGENKVTEFIMSDVNANVQIWDITSRDSVRLVEYTFEGDDLRFRMRTDILREFIAFDGSFYYPVEPVGIVENQDLHAMTPSNMIIVSHPEFREQAQILADFHTSRGLTTQVATTDRIYNEFGSGKQDIAAIRDFVRMIYLNGGSTVLKYLLIFGDGSYDYRERVPGNTNFVPTYQSKESLKPLGTYVTDDFFGLMDQHEGADCAGRLDLGIGRFPVTNTSQAMAIINKILDYHKINDTTFGNWKNKITFIADDEDTNLHLNQAEELADITKTKYPVFNVEKIYSDAYQIIQTPSGTRYPEVNKAISKAVNEGRLIINYTGHGGEDGWSAEKILTIPDVQGWTNKDKYAVFITATCEFSRFDNPERFSAGEMVIVNPDAGAVALYTTTRLALATSNFKLDTSFFRNLMNKDQDGNYLRLGDLIRISKNNNNNNNNIRNFVLLGDPAQSLAFPELDVKTTHINATPVDSGPVALTALSPVEIRGIVTDGMGNQMTGYSGTIRTTIYDKWVNYTTLANQEKSLAQMFQVQNVKLFDGQATVTGGDFTISFNMPAGINTQQGAGKISYYTSGSQVDGYGLHTGITIGGVDPAIDPVNAGPQISLFMNDRGFISGSPTDADPTLIADFSDEQGINAIDLGIGHEILAVLDDDWAHPIILNSYYQSALDDYRSGTLNYAFSDLAPGMHSLTVRAWDMYDNPSQATILFFVSENQPPSVTQVFNYPNPFSTGTWFTFSPPASGGILNVQVQIFSLYGEPVHQFEFTIEDGQGVPQTRYWDGRTDRGATLANGIYPYRVLFRNGSGAWSETSQKLIILN